AIMNPGDLLDDQSEEGTHIEVTVEEKDLSIKSDLGWKPAIGLSGQPTETSFVDDVLCRGKVKLPDKRSKGQFRLVIREYERLYQDNPSLPLGISIPTKSFPGRLVYAEVLEV